jgi:hypothetical protein
MRKLGRTIIPATVLLALVNIALGGIRLPLILWECLLVVHAWILSSYWRNRAEGNPAEYISIEVSDRWDGDPDEADFGVLVATVATLLFPFGWIFFGDFV